MGASIALDCCRAVSADSGGGMSAENLLDAAVAGQIKTRIDRLTPESERHWGRMSVAQMLTHCCTSMQWAVGEVVPERLPFAARLMGRLVKPLALRDGEPMRRNSPTAKSLIVETEPNFVDEQQRLLTLIDSFVAGGASGCTRKPHSFFGEMTPQEWAKLMHKHLDHHLRQFGV
ncbi:MAG TPA: DUF1569 domain-containing protein [Acidobacterium sp.]|nr:DUF1569 domain-containing protein [Acidobacterium sp.]